MAMSDISSKAFVAELLRLSTSIIWKDAYKAAESEKSSDRMEMEAYLAARNDELRFNSIPMFHTEVLSIFFPDPEELALVSMEKKLIPDEMRDDIVASEQRFLINKWENEDGEANAYYRMLYGLPPLEISPDKYLFNTAYADIPMDIPIHKLQYTDRLKLESRGFTAKLLKENPAHEYLKHIGRYRVFPYQSRQAEQFALLYMDKSQFDYLRNDFIDVYEECRRMVVRVYYSDAYRNKDHLFEGFLALSILFMSQQRMFSKYLETDITRDFYDLESLKLVYDAYGMPFYSSIPLKYHHRIVKHMNELISYKGSTQVFYDLFKIFDFGHMDVFEYYLVKERLVDSHGNPIFRDAYNRPLTDEQMWNIRFARVGWVDDKYIEVTNPENVIPYEQLTSVDPYWVEDEGLKKKLYGEDWNYFHSKYVGVQLMFELSKLIFETCYFFKMLQDNRANMSQVTCYYTVTGEDIPLFDMIIYAVALLCKNAGFSGEIPSDPASVSAVYGFNFKEYNELLKMGTDSMDDFVKSFETACKNYANENPVLSVDKALYYWIDQITDGAFSYLGDDFPYDQPGMAPTPMFLDDFIPTNNSVVNLKKYLSETIERLRGDSSLTDLELYTLYSKLVTSDNFVFQVQTIDSVGMNIKHQDFLLKKRDFTDEDVELLRQAILASYEQMLSWVIKLLDTRKALTFDSYILDLIKDMNVNEFDDVDRVYRCIEELDRYLTVKIQTTFSRTDYNAYANIRKILMTTTLMTEVFTKRDGTVASTYGDLLADINQSLYRRFTDEAVDSELEETYVLQTFMQICTDLTLLEGVNTNHIKKIVEYLYKILRFLKSAKVDLTNFQIIYLITDRSMNYIKLLSEIYATFVIDAHTKDWFIAYDWLHTTQIVQYLDEHLFLETKNHEIDVAYQIRDMLEKLTDKDELYTQAEQVLGSSFQYWLSWITGILIDHYVKEPLKLAEKQATDVEWDNTTVSQFHTKSTITPGEMTVKISTNWIIDAIDKNFFENTFASIDHLKLLKDGVHIGHVQQTGVTDAIMWKDTLIKVSEAPIT